MADAQWLAELLADREGRQLLHLIAGANADTRFAADDATYDVLASHLDAAGLAKLRLVKLGQLSVHLAADFDIQRIVVVSSVDEEADRLAVMARLAAEQMPAPILQTLDVLTLVADVIPLLATKRPMPPRPRSASAGPLPRMYAIVNAPRAGSTYLGDLLSSGGLGHAIEHVRDWGVGLLRARPPSLFDFPRFVRNLIAADTHDGVFGTKLISHFLIDLEPLLSPAERSFLAVLIAETRLIYLYRTDKLDQAISTHRARATGVWHAMEATPDAAPANLGEDYEAISQMMRQAELQERQLADRFVDAPCLFVNYDALVDDAAAVCHQAAAFIGMPLTATPASPYVKLADQASESLRRGFLASGRAPLNLTGEAAVRDARDRRAAAREDAAKRAEQIRRGHAKSRHGDYQDRHYYLIDYDHQPDPRVDFMYRGPRPSGLDTGDYVAFIGASQTLGAFVDRPFAQQVSETLGVERLNLGRGGAGPEFFLRGGQVEQWIRNARAVVVQVMAARMVGNARFSSVEGRALVNYRSEGGEVAIDCDEAWQRIVMEFGPQTRAELAEESRRRWIAATRAIADIAQGPTTLLWLSSRSPDYEATVSTPQGLLGEFPQLVNRAMVGVAAKSYDAYLEVVSPQTMEPTRSTFSGEVLPVIFGGGTLESQSVGAVNHYYPTQAMHDAAAAALVPTLAQQLNLAPR